MKKRAILIFSGIVIVFLVVLILFTTRQKSKNTALVSITPVATSFTYSIPESPQIKTNGTEIKNIYKDSVTVTADKNAVIADDAKYQIVYLQKYDQFVISILTPDFSEGRLLAENKILEKTGLTTETACGVNVSITTPAFVNQELAGKIFGLSFCPSK